MMKRLLVAVTMLAFVISAGVAYTADTASVAVSATVIGTCQFNSGGTMAFGNLDPSSGADVAAVVTQPAFWCTKNASYSMTDDDGLYELGGSHRVRHATDVTEFIPYSFTYTASGTGSGRNTAVTMDIAGQITSANYEDSAEGAYADTVVLSITP